MKPFIIESKCDVNSGCKLVTICPVEAISYVKVCKSTVGTVCDCGCDCKGDCHCDESCSCMRSKLVIDYDKCIACGACAENCCTGAIEMKE